MKENSATGRRYDREFKQNAVELVRATTSPEQQNTDTPELLSAAQLSREAKVSMGLVQDRLNMGEIKPDFRSGRTLLFAATRLPELREVLRHRY